MKMEMKTIRHATIALAMTLLASTAAGASQPLLAPRTGDLVPAGLQAAPLPGDRSERMPLAFAWALDPAQPVDGGTPYVAVSRSFWQQVDGSVLQQGMELPLSAADAVILVSPARAARPLLPSQLQLRDPAGQAHAVHAVDARQLQATGMPARDGSLVLRSGSSSVVGIHHLQSSQAQGRYIVQVLEPNSPLRLELESGRSQVLTGDVLQVRARLVEDGAALSAAAGSRVGGEALLVAPDGRSWPQPVSHEADGSLRMDVRVPAEGSAAAGLWELQLFARGRGVLRDGKVAFAVARPVARFSGQVMPNAVKREVALALQVAAPGRYEARGTLFATAPDGQLRPVAQAHVAAWFDRPGAGTLDLSFAGATLPAGYGAPFELRHLQLQDQSRMAPIESRALALRF